MVFAGRASFSRESVPSNSRVVECAVLHFLTQALLYDLRNVVVRCCSAQPWMLTDCNVASYIWHC